MASHIRKTLVIVVTLLFFAPFAQAQSNPKYKELPNFHKVNDRIYRGAQPRKGGIKRLSELGIRTIINLRHTSDETRREQREAEAAGMKFFNVPMATLGRPSDRQVSRVLEIIDHSDNSPIFIHCKRGSDRTGLVIGIYRISHEGWTSSDSVTEAKQHGMRWIQFAKKNYIADYHRWYAEQNRDMKASSINANVAQSIAPLLLVDTGRDFDKGIGRSISAIEYSLEQTRHALRWFFKKAVFAH